jgi:hypothetical protein
VTHDSTNALRSCGANPAELPIQQPTAFAPVLNLDHEGDWA